MADTPLETKNKTQIAFLPMEYEKQILYKNYPGQNSSNKKYMDYLYPISMENFISVLFAKYLFKKHTSQKQNKPK